MTATEAELRHALELINLLEAKGRVEDIRKVLDSVDLTVAKAFEMQNGIDNLYRAVRELPLPEPQVLGLDPEPWLTPEIHAGQYVMVRAASGPHTNEDRFKPRRGFIQDRRPYA